MSGKMKEYYNGASVEDLIDRAKAVKAMEYLCRQINDETVFESWLTYGVPDGDIDLGDLEVNENNYEDLDILLNDKVFAELMHTFLNCMKNALRSGGLYCGDVLSE